MLALVIDVTGYNELRELYCEEGITSVSTNRPQANSVGTLPAAAIID